MRLSGRTFHRLFSINLYKNRRLLLGEMDFFKDFTKETRGDPYPVFRRSEGARETIGHARYRVTSEDEGGVTRLLCGHFPFASYEARLRFLRGRAGFVFRADGREAAVLLEADGNGQLFLVVREEGCEERIRMEARFRPGLAFLLSTRGDRIDVYLAEESVPRFQTTVTLKALSGILREEVFRTSFAAFCAGGEAETDRVTSFLDSGISQADIRPVKYENGAPYVRDGKIYLTLSVRMEEGSYQGVFSWIPGTAEFEMTGALFFAAGDGTIAGDVAASLHYDRRVDDWILWICSFSHGHVLARTRARGEFLRGVHIVDVRLMEPMGPGDHDEAFLGKEGDEDPDLIWSEERGEWILSLCRLTGTERKYRYFFFASEDPLDGYTCFARTGSGEDTGGSLLYDEGKLLLSCGSRFDARAEYRIYDPENPGAYELLRFDYDDGGFRGWGSLVAWESGNRIRLFHLTFDRAKGSGYNWSYGNLYCFEG